ncbi:MAG TPA: DUF58 domain-containing protein [Acidimicrobiales bacterium]|nr:DUF58 domain-containing protein [Acidimicrobiales bacterium]
MALWLFFHKRSPVRPPEVVCRLTIQADDVYEGEALDLSLRVAIEPGYRVCLHALPGNAVVVTGSSADRSGGSFTLRVDQWGRRDLGAVHIVIRDQRRLSEAHGYVHLPRIICYPRPDERIATAVRARTSARSGEREARASGDGADFTGVRPYSAGDRQRRINWSATTRQRWLQVNTFAAERSQDIVILIDGGSEIGPAGSTSVDISLRGALGLAKTYLRARDRVGLVVFGPAPMTLPLGAGQRHFARIRQAVSGLRDTPTPSRQPSGSPAGTLDRLLAARTPPSASVIAFSPLVDPALVQALRDLRERGFQIFVVDVLNGDIGRELGSGALDRMTRRLWQLRREALYFSLSELGVGVAHWDGEEPYLNFSGPHERRQTALTYR